MKYERILATAIGQPWLIEPGAGQRLMQLLARRAAGHRATDDELQAAANVKSERQSRKDRQRQANVAYIGLHGPMVQRADWFMEACGIPSSEQIGRLIDMSVEDPEIEAIVLDVDSPGGSVFGTPELAAKVAKAAKKKKITAVINSLCASAAYYVASQASEIVITPSGMCGSIGVVMMHVDESKALDMKGVRVTVVASSEQKAAGMDPGPLTDVGRAEMESHVQGYFTEFVRAVAKGRGVSASTVEKDFGRGGVLLAREAVKVGMADKVATLDDVLSGYGWRISAWGDGFEQIAGARTQSKKHASSGPGRSELTRDPETARRWREMEREEEEEHKRLDAKTEIRRRKMLLDDDPPAERKVNRSTVKATSHNPPLTRSLVRVAWHEAAHASTAVAVGSTAVAASIIADKETGGGCITAPRDWTLSSTPSSFAQGHWVNGWIRTTTGGSRWGATSSTGRF